jgi:hypothetical protein
MNGPADIADIDLGVFGPAVASWSRAIANAGEDIRPQVFRNCAAEGAGFVRKGADRGDIVAALIERAERHGLTVQLGGIEGVEATIAAALEAEVIAASVKLINLDDHHQVPAQGPRVKIKATPYIRVDPKSIPMRDWLYGRLLVRQFLSMTIAPGGVGKSSLVVVEALAKATGRDLLGVKPPRPLKVWLWNLEDPQEETERKIEAACIHYDIKTEETDGQLFVNSGRDQPLVIAKTLRAGVTIMHPVIDDLVEQIKELGIDVLVIDPFVSCHEVEENDNSAIDQVAKQWSRVAELGDCAVEIVHHTRKAPAGTEVTTESGRGAKALSDASRVARTLNRMSDEEAKSAGVGVENARSYFRAFNDKANLAPPTSKSDWFQLIGVPLGNGPFDTEGDDVGVIVKWTWPDHTAGITGTDFDKVAVVIRGGKWRKDGQAKQWVGQAVAQALGLDVTGKSDRAKADALVKFWIKTRALIEVQGDDEKRNQRTFVEVRPEE